MKVGMSPNCEIRPSRASDGIVSSASASLDHRERQLPRVLAQLAAEGGERRCQAVVELLHGRKTRTRPEW